MVLTVAAYAATGQSVFSFDGAVASSGLLNSALSGGASVTVSGLHFGNAQHTSTSSLALGDVRHIVVDIEHDDGMPHERHEP